MRIAIVGTGIAGNTVAHFLHRAGHQITVFEADGHIGGHTHTHRIEVDGEVHDIDTGFIVFNHWTYPNFIGLLDELGVAHQPTSMSFSVRNDASGLEYNGTSLDGLFAQRRNLLRPSFLRMLGEILRFNREAPRLLDRPGGEQPLGDFLEAGGYGQRFIDDYLVPMGAAIWSTDADRMLRFPARFFVRFLHNHGMLSVNHRPTWRVIAGGSARYVERLVQPWRDHVRLNTPVESVRRLPGGVLVTARGHEPERFDHVFLACHADQALGLLADPSREEIEVLAALPFQSNEAVLHTDTSLLPKQQRAWAAWNYHADPRSRHRVALTYNMNILQGLRSRHTFCVTLNATDRIDPGRILKRLHYEHPLFTLPSVAAQGRHAEISGVRRTHYCGAYWRYGFHEDGVVSAIEALKRFNACQASGDHAQRDLHRVA